MTSKTIIVVRHHEGDLDDTASTHLAARGYNIENWAPFKQPVSSALPSISGVAGTIVMGGEQNVTEIDQLPYLHSEIDWIVRCIEAELPVIGICLGSQLLAHALGGEVLTHKKGLCEFGYEPVHPADNNNPWFTSALHVTQAHFQGFTLPPDSTALAVGENFPCQAFLHKHNVFGFQFHPEVHQNMFEQWLQSDWKDEFYATPGARPAHQQSQDNQKYNKQQTAWFKSFLDKVFG